MLAIVIPYYKIAFFEETLASLAGQTNKDFKVYIGNDHSPEDPEALIEKYFEILDITYLKFDENLGGKCLPAHWDRCIEMTRGEEWFMILGDDDMLEPKVVACWYEKFKNFEGKSRLIRFATSIIDEDSRTVSGTFEHPQWEKVTDSFFRKFDKTTRSSLSEYIFQESSYKKFGIKKYPLGWHSDDRAWFDFSEGLPIYTINEASVQIRISPESISGKTNNFDAKNKASMAFFRFLIFHHLSDFQEEQRLKLMMTYEWKIMYEDRLKIQDWFFLLYFYVRSSRFYHFRRFLKLSFRSILKPGHA